MDEKLLSADPRQIDASLRAQLADVSMASQVLLRKCTSEKDEAYLAIIHRAAMRANLILEHVELTRRLEDEDELRAAFGAEELVSWCRDRVEHTAPLLENLGITLSFHAKETALVTQADSALLEHLLFALLSNGAKAMPDGGHLSVTLSKTNRAAVLTVGDDGEGLSESAMNRLFGEGDPDPDLTPGAGAGLGLRLAHTIAEVHGGLLILDTAPGGGTRAAVSLPLREGRPSRLQSAEPPIALRDRALVALSDVLSAEVYTFK